jgi:hypothetical protein
VLSIFALSDIGMENLKILSEIKLLEQNKDLVCRKSTRVTENGTFGVWHFVNQWTGLKHQTYILPLTWNKSEIKKTKKTKWIFGLLQLKN